MKTCSRCGKSSEADSVFCPQCGALVAPKTPGQNAKIAPDAPGGSRTQKGPKRDTSQAHREDSTREEGQRRGHSVSTRTRFIVIAGSILVIPAVYLVGYLSSFHQAQAMQQNLAPLATVGRTATPSRSATQANTSATTANPNSTPKVSTKVTTQPAVVVLHKETISGTIVNGHLQTTLYFSQRYGGSRLSGTVWVDTGSAMTHILGSFAKRLGLAMSNTGAVLSGYGGNAQADNVAGVTAYGPSAFTPMFSDVLLTSGISAVPQGPDLLLGENFLRQGVLVQNQTTWSFTFMGPLNVTGPAETSLLGVSLPTPVAGDVPVSGTLTTNYQLMGQAAIGTSAKAFFPGQMTIDTGNFSTFINGGLLRQEFGAQPEGSATYYGVGGEVQASEYAGIYLEGYQSSQPLLVNATMTSGVGAAYPASQYTPQVVISIGEEFLGHAEFWQIGKTWEAYLQPLEGPDSVAANEKPWWYPTYYRSNPGP